eukprot:GHVL01004567.1.p1 GENE.GHVL01004567.1~~GHVL01004567.1.p1  ORF type:complete len:103 (-),score=2.10 GHVL01004567.1:1377-1685(-)
MLLKVDGVHGADGEEVCALVHHRGVVVTRLVPQTARGHARALVLVLAHGDYGDDLVALQPRGLDPLLDQLGQRLAQQREAARVVRLLRQVHVQHAKTQHAKC